MSEEIKDQEILEETTEDKLQAADEPKTGEDVQADKPDKQEMQSPGEEEKKEEKPPKPKKSGFQKRIDKLTRQKKELQEQLERMKAELERLKGGNIEDPREEDFDTYEDYIKAVARAEFQRVRAQQLEQDHSKLEEKAKELDSYALEEKRAIVDAIIEEGIKKKPDYVQVVFSNPFLPEHLADAVMVQDNADEIFYYLGKNPLESRRLANLPPDKLPTELAKIQASVSQHLKPSAPPPLEPVEGGEGHQEDLADDLPIEEWIKRRNKQLSRGG